MILRFVFVFFAFMTSFLCAQEQQQDFRSSLLQQWVLRDTTALRQTSDISQLAELHANRGESLLLLEADEYALADFELACQYASQCQTEEISFLTFRPLFGAFLAYIRLEDLEHAQVTAALLEQILKNHTCRECAHEIATAERHFCYGTVTMPKIFQTIRADHPILGPNTPIPDYECLDRVDAMVAAITPLIAVVKRAEVQALAWMVINELADQARYCCLSGGMWKACLQPLVNKLHYWKVLGIPADPMWDD